MFYKFLIYELFFRKVGISRSIWWGGGRECLIFIFTLCPGVGVVRVGAVFLFEKEGHFPIAPFDMEFSTLWGGEGWSVFMPTVQEDPHCCQCAV